MDAIHVVGAGGIGCAVGYALRATGVPVTFVESNSTKLEAGRRDGVRVDNRPPLPAEFVHFDDWRPNTAALVLLCNKCYDNAAVLAKLTPETPTPSDPERVRFATGVIRTHRRRHRVVCVGMREGSAAHANHATRGVACRAKISNPMRSTHPGPPPCREGESKPLASDSFSGARR